MTIKSVFKFWLSFVALIPCLPFILVGFLISMVVASVSFGWGAFDKMADWLSKSSPT